MLIGDADLAAWERRAWRFRAFHASILTHSSGGPQGSDQLPVRCAASSATQSDESNDGARQPRNGLSRPLDQPSDTV